MQKYVFVVMSGGIEAEEVDVDGMRNPGERMPIACVTVSESTHRGIQRQHVFYMRIIRDVLGVVDVDERVTVNGGIDGDGGYGEQQAQNDGTNNRVPEKKAGLRLTCRLNLSADGRHYSPPESRDEYIRF